VKAMRGLIAPVAAVMLFIAVVDCEA